MIFVKRRRVEDRIPGGVKVYYQTGETATCNGTD